MNALRSALYRIARLLGWINAIERGKLLQRIVRVAILRAAGSVAGRVR